MTFITQVKGNQSGLLKQLQYGVKLKKKIDFFKDEIVCDHGRIEERFTTVFDAKPMLKKFVEWNKIEQVIVVDRKRICKKTGIESCERAVYVSNAKLSAEKYCRYIRQHWEIENGLHYVKDGTFFEDASRRRIKSTIFSRFISFSMNCMRKNNIKNIRTALYENPMSIDKVIHMAS